MVKKEDHLELEVRIVVAVLADQDQDQELQINASLQSVKLVTTRICINDTEN